ncbi:MAG: hypothetical protein J6S61_04025, partial [Elusimicrobiaceae bacterium]|nr:hypothetical protein [Elusimicrobiaceae bacterium]
PRIKQFMRYCAIFINKNCPVQRDMASVKFLTEFASALARGTCLCLRQNSYIAPPSNPAAHKAVYALLCNFYK